MHWYLSCFKHYGSFSGRARRREFWWFTLVNSLIFIALGLLAVASRYLSFALASVIYTLIGLYSLAVVFPSLAVLTRRLHDTGHTMAFAVAPLVLCALCSFLSFIATTKASAAFSVLAIFASILSLVIVITALIFTLLDSEAKANLYGPSPKYAMGSFRCASCNKVITAGSDSCPHCGREVAKAHKTVLQCTCPHCNQSTDANRDFCVKCGKPLPAQPVAQSSTL